MLTCFKSYDVRGRLGHELTEAICESIGRAFARVMDPGTVVTGRDIRPSSADLQAALHRGLVAEGVRVIDIGLCGTEEVYFATPHYEAGGGLMVTASHNPMDYNGIKMVRAGARPISGDTGLTEIQAATEAGGFGPVRPGGGVVRRDPRSAYVAHLMGYVAPAALGPLRIVVNGGNGAAGPTLDAVLAALRGAPLQIVRINHAPDGSFPNGIPNPLLPENRAVTAEAVRDHGADMGVAWDGDFDRCFFFDETGAFVDGEYVVTLLARAFCAKEPGALIIHDPRVIWATGDAVRRAGGRPVLSRVGHSHIKTVMREHDAAYGGEMSAHHYFRDFNYCDSGMIPWLLMTELVSRSGRPLSAMLAELRRDFPSSGEVNFRISDQEAAVEAFEAAYGPRAGAEDRLDGISYDMGGWRVNLRRSNTEPVVRLNIESRGDGDLVAAKLAEIRALLAPYTA